MENSMIVPSKIKSRITVWFSNSTSQYKHPSNESGVSREYVYRNVHNSFIHSSHKVEEIQAFTDRWIEKQNVYVHRMEYYTTFKKEKPDTWCNMDAHWGHYAEWNQPVTKRQMLHKIQLYEDTV